MIDGLAQSASPSSAPADLINAAQILYATSTEHGKARHMFDSRDAKRVRQIVARSQIPRFSSVLNLLYENGAGPSDLTKRAFTWESNEEAASLSEGDLKKRKSISQESGGIPEKLYSSFSLSTGDEDVDKLLGGGLRKGCLTEVVGQR
jgi:hypothetical protein